MAEQDKPKIIVDDDWKAQAQAEKQRLESEAEQAPGGHGAPRELPPATMQTLISSLSTQAVMALGGYEDPRTKQRYVDLDLAKHFIDTLALLEQKTRGNLTQEEKDLLDRAIYELRMSYVQVAQHVGGI
jgi:hypothetical protein